MVLLIRWLFVATAIVLASRLFPGVHVHGWGPAFVGAAVLGVLNLAVRPILVVLTLPVTLVTFGLFLFVVNAAMFAAMGAITGGMRVEGFFTALAGSLLVSVATMLADRWTMARHA